MAKAMTPAQTLAQMKKWNVPYREYHGWETRGRGPMGEVHGIIIHHTGSDAQSDSYLQFLAVDGRGDLPAPLCNVSTDMDGDLWLIAAARANHAGAGSSAILAHVIDENYSATAYKQELKPGPDDLGGTFCNGSYYGNEVRYDGGQPMTDKQFASAVRWAAAVCDFHGWSAQSVIGHREHTTRKPDPGNCPMYKFRLAVSGLLAAGPPQPKPPAQPPVQQPSTEDEDMTVDEYEEYNSRLYGTKGTLGIWHQQEVDHRKAVLEAMKAQTDALNALAAAIQEKV